MYFVLATKNRGKIIEFKKLFMIPEIEIVGLDHICNIENVNIKEDGTSFEENAIKKARFIAKKFGYPAIADDSGLVVYALNGLPGIYSARFAGENATDLENNLKLLKEMKNIKDRKAEFVCVIALVFPDEKTFTYEGRCQGMITYDLIGDKGFGYDPLFYYPPLNKTFAQMSPDEKNMISHRARAIQKIKKDINNILEYVKKWQAITYL